MSAELERLHSVLSELDDLIRAEHPDLHPRLRPGLPDDELERLAEGLLPYHLPTELVALYRWHDGWEADAGGTYRYLLPSADFDGLAGAIMGYRGWLDALGSDGWHPLWFPAFGWQSGELVALQLEPDRPAGQVYSFDSESGLSTSYDSVTAMFSTALDLWRRGLLPEGTAYPEIPRVVAEHNLRSRTRDGAPLSEISRSASRDWPADWKHVLGIGPLVPAAGEDVVTIAEFTRDPSCGRPIHAELRGLAGSGETFFATASDGTGSVAVLLVRDETENFREAEGSGRFELWPAPLEDDTHAAELARDMRSFFDVGPVLYFVRKVVPL